MGERKNRTKKIIVRFTEDEYKLVLEMERVLGLTKSELVRSKLLTGSAALVINAKELIAELAIIGAEMNREGNNINQLARHANTLRLQGRLGADVVSHFIRLMDAHLENQQKLEVSLRKVIRSLIH